MNLVLNFSPTIAPAMPATIVPAAIPAIHPATSPARRRGDAIQALRGFEQAAEAALRQGRHRAAALACEQAALLADDCGLASAARHYRQQALDAGRRPDRPVIDGAGVFGLTLTHELNQPLAAVTLHAAAAGKWLRRAQPDIERALDSLALIDAAGRQAGDIVRNMQRLAAGQDHETASVDVDAAVRDALRLLHPPLRRHGIEVELALDLDGCAIDANRAQLQQVATNLVMNAIEAHAGAGLAGARRIRIASRRCGGHAVELEVSDNGPGIAAHDCERLFTSRFSTKRGRDGAGTGTGAGLGLPITLSIVRAHGGRLWFEPCLPHGASFRLRLPVHAGQPAA